MGKRLRHLRPAVFLDRDGTLIPDAHYRRDDRSLRFLKGTVDALRLLCGRRVLIFVVTNQSGVARGFFQPAMVERVHRKLAERLRRFGVRVHGWYYCPHFPGAAVERFSKVCRCRKPAPGLVEKARRRFKFDPKKSFVIGDREADMALARRAKLAGAVLVRTGAGRRTEKTLKKGAYLTVKKNLLAAVRWLIREKKI